jgi:hypothetical protein
MVCSSCYQTQRRYEAKMGGGAARRKQYREQLRLDAVNHYGGCCACCRADYVGFLEIDHVEGGGNVHRRRLLVEGKDLYLWLKGQGYPSGYRPLCHNCHTEVTRSGSCSPELHTRLD